MSTEMTAGVAKPASTKNITIRVKKLVPEAVLPEKATVGSGGFDLTVANVEHCPFNHQYKYGFGIAVEIPEGYTGFLFPRSSIKDTNLDLSNSVGVIDSDYRGEIKAVFNTLGRSYDNEYQVGDRAVQLIIIRTPSVTFVEAEELDATERGEGGYGSTGN